MVVLKTNHVKEIRKILKFNSDWEKLSDTKKELKLYSILEKIHLGNEKIILTEIELVPFYNQVLAELEKNDVLIDSEIDSRLQVYINKREYLSKREGEEIKIVTIHFSNCLFVLELFPLKEGEFFVPYFTLLRDCLKFRSEIVDLF